MYRQTILKNIDNEEKKTNLTIYDALKNLIEHKETSDIRFNFSSTKDTICAHKCILSMRSPVFAAMIHGDWIEKNNVLITDISINVFRKFITYLYTDNGINLSIETDDFIADLMYAAHKYEIIQLENIIGEFISNKINTTNVLCYYKIYHFYNNSIIVRKCMNMISSNTLKVIDCDEFKTLPIELVKNILQLNRFSVSEYVLFKGVLEWAAKQCKIMNLQINSTYKRKVLMGAHRLIRFPTMQPQEFFNIIVMEPNFFEPIEIGEIFMTIRGENTTSIYSNVCRYDSSKLSKLFMLMKMVNVMRNV